MSTQIVDLDEIVFQSRNKSYGAYVLRQLYPRNVSRAFAIALSLMVLAMLWPLISEYLSSEDLLDQKKKSISYAELSEPPPIDKKEEQIKPPEVEPPPPPKAASIKFVIPEPVADDKAKPEETIASVDSILKSNPGLETQEGSNDAPVDFGDVDGKGNTPSEIKETEKEPDPNEFIAVEKEAAPVNMDDIKKAIGYPPTAKEAGISGKVILRLLVGKDGSVVKHIVIKSPHKILTEAVVPHLSSLKFTPAIQANRPVQTWVTIPFDFRLQ
ncbi:MAG: TonB family protein [Bacteroidia bacterium]|nr:TonB family protein [Bacteroidia bacterium]